MSEPTIFINKLYSCEYYSRIQSPNSPFKHVLEDINFIAYPGQLWSILGSSVFEIKLLLEIMANARTYEKGRLKITGFDTTRKKRLILPEVFYIGSTNMAFGNMNVLEYLMFITRNSSTKAVDRQEYLLNYLINLELGYICLTPISLLNEQEKSIVILVSAMLSDSLLIIMNLPRLMYNEREISSINKIVSEIQNLNKTFIISTQCYELAQSISSHICFIHKSRILYNDTLDKFLDEYDKVSFIIQVDDLNNIIQTLSNALPQFEYEIDGNVIQIIDNSGDNNSITILCHILSSLNIEPNYVQRNKKNIKNSIKRLIRLNDI